MLSIRQKFYHRTHPERWQGIDVGLTGSDAQKLIESNFSPFQRPDNVEYARRVSQRRTCQGWPSCSANVNRCHKIHCARSCHCRSKRYKAKYPGYFELWVPHRQMRLRFDVNCNLCRFINRTRKLCAPNNSGLNLNGPFGTKCSFELLDGLICLLASLPGKEAQSGVCNNHCYFRPLHLHKDVEVAVHLRVNCSQPLHCFSPNLWHEPRII